MKQQTNKPEAAHRKPKTKHIDVRFTEDEYNIIEKAAAACGMFKSNYLHDLGLGHQYGWSLKSDHTSWKAHCAH